jgi:hypothetical protein
MMARGILDDANRPITNVFYNQVSESKAKNLGVSNYVNITSDMPLTYCVLLIDYKIVIPSYTIFEPQRVE